MEEEEEEEKPALLVWLGERLVRKLLTQATIDIWEEEQAVAVILISSDNAPVADGELVAVGLPVPIAETDWDKQRLFRLLAPIIRAE